MDRYHARNAEIGGSGEGGGRISITIPKGWEAAVKTGRIIKAGLCSYMDIKEGRVTVEDYFEMHTIVDSMEYLAMKARG